MTKQDSWKELRTYIGQILSIGAAGSAQNQDRSLFATELAQYQNAKRTGRGRTAVCGLCSSPYKAAKQKESALLFSPQVYSNKLPLHGSNALRDICPICGIEIMLRQLLMNHSNATGGRFENRQMRYLYFYPTYFFSPETLEMFRAMHNQLHHLSFTELRRQLTGGESSDDGIGIRLDANTLQHLEPLLLSAEDLGGNDRFARMEFPRQDPITFYFLGIPPTSRDAKDAESWIYPAFLALLMPLCLDVKVVVSTSPLPILNEANDIAEMVLFDGAHAFVRYLIEQERVNINQVLPCLQKLIVTYLIHLDANSRQRRGQWDYHWSSIPPLARHLSANAAYACHYLKKWQHHTELDFPPDRKINQYTTYISYLSEGCDTMSHARKLVEYSRQFYRPRKYNSNNILRPLSVVAGAILDANRRLFTGYEDLTEVAYGELLSFMERVGRQDAYGQRSPRETGESVQEAAKRREKYMQCFTRYFVQTIFFDALHGDVAALRGKQLNLLKNAYEVAYRQVSIDDRQSDNTSEDEQ